MVSGFRRIRDARIPMNMPLCTNYWPIFFQGHGIIRPSVKWTQTLCFYTLLIYWCYTFPTWYETFNWLLTFQWRRYATMHLYKLKSPNRWWRHGVLSLDIFADVILCTRMCYVDRYYSGIRLLLYQTGSVWFRGWHLSVSCDLFMIKTVDTVFEWSQKHNQIHDDFMII